MEWRLNGKTTAGCFHTGEVSDPLPPDCGSIGEKKKKNQHYERTGLCLDWMTPESRAGGGCHGEYEDTDLSFTTNKKNVTCVASRSDPVFKLVSVRSLVLIHGLKDEFTDGNPYPPPPLFSPHCAGEK